MSESQEIRRQANAEIAAILSKINSLLTEAEVIADKAGVSFSFNPSGAYGAGASYTGAAAVDDWERSEYEVEDGEGYWASSSQSC